MKKKDRWLGAVVLMFLTACSSAQKKTEPVLSELHGKKVALVSVEGEATAKRVVEVSLINELVKRGTFILVSKQDVEAARLAPDQDPMDWQGIARRAGAEYALRGEVLQFDAVTHEGYSSEKVYDSQIAQEQGTDGQTERIYKVKSLEGHVKVKLEFTNLASKDTRSAVAAEDGRAEDDAKTTGIHLPPRLRFLEELANKAFRKFFERYN